MMFRKEIGIFSPAHRRCSDTSTGVTGDLFMSWSVNEFPLPLDFHDFYGLIALLS